MNRFILWLNKQKYGKATHVVKVTDFEVRRSSFRPCPDERCPEGIDREALMRYGLALRAAEAFCAQKYFLYTEDMEHNNELDRTTDRPVRGNLLCGYVHDLPVIEAKIIVDRNLYFLTGAFMSLEDNLSGDKGLRFLTKCITGMREGHAIASVSIPDFFRTKREQDIEPGPFSILFLGNPVEVG